MYSQEQVSFEQNARPQLLVTAHFVLHTCALFASFQHHSSASTMASGVAVSSEIVSAFQKLVKQRKFRGATFTINNTMTEVQLEKTYAQATGDAKSAWDEFARDLPNSDCRFAAYDFAFEHQGAQKTKVIFVLWTGEGAKTRSKMIYASSQEAVVRALEGVQRQLQCTDENEISYEVIAKQLAVNTAGY
jgi:cofilin